MRLLISFLVILFCKNAFSSPDAPLSSADLKKKEFLSLYLAKDGGPNGSMIFLSKDTRYKIVATVEDTWSGKKITSQADIDYAKTHIDLSGLKIDFSTLNTFSLKGGDKKVTVFVDPECKFCKKLVADAKNHLDEYSFNFVVVPALGDKSNVLSKSMFCSKPVPSMAHEYLSGNLGSLEQKTPCDTTRYDLTLMVAQMVGITSVPFVIAPDGRFQAGGDPWKFLEQPIKSDVSRIN